jgi:hypothetical protein
MFTCHYVRDNVYTYDMLKASVSSAGPLSFVAHATTAV